MGVRARAFAAAGGGVAAAQLFGPVASAPTSRLLGTYGSEAGPHAELLASALVGGNGCYGVAGDPNAPERVTTALVDPLAALLMWAPFHVAGGGLTGFVVAWNALWLVALVGAAGGAWAWSRAWLQDDDAGEWGAATASVLASSSMFLANLTWVGRMESVLTLLYPVHAALFIRAALIGRVAPTRRFVAWALAAGSAAAFVASGGGGALFFAIVEVLLVAWLATEARARTWITAVGIASVAVASALSLWPLLSAGAAWPYPFTLAPPRTLSSLPHLGLLFGRSEDFRHDFGGYEYAPWMGYGPVAAAGLTLGVAAWRRTWRAAIPVVIAGVLIALTLGGAIRVGSAEVAGPLAWVEALPGSVGMFRGWPRLVAFAIPFAAMGGAWAVSVLPRTGLPPAASVAVASLLSLVALLEPVIRSPSEDSWGIGEVAAVATLPAGGAASGDSDRAGPPASSAAPAAPPAASAAATIELPWDARSRLRQWLVPQARIVTGPAFADLIGMDDTLLPDMPPRFDPFDPALAIAVPFCRWSAATANLSARGLRWAVLRREDLDATQLLRARLALTLRFGDPVSADVWALPEHAPPCDAPTPLSVHFFPPFHPVPAFREAPDANSPLPPRRNRRAGDADGPRRSR